MQTFSHKVINQTLVLVLAVLVRSGTITAIQVAGGQEPNIQ